MTAPTTGPPVRLVLADDHPPLRAGIRALLEAEAARRGTPLDVVGEASGGHEALRLVRLHEPDVLVTDVEMPDLDGVALARAVREARLPTRVLALSAYDDPAYVRGLQGAGAAGYLTKENPAAVIAEAVFAVARGQDRWFVGVPADPAAELTGRERDVLRALARGLSNQEIADALGVAENTVRNHLTVVYEKLGLPSARADVAWAWAHGIAGGPDAAPADRAV